MGEINNDGHCWGIHLGPSWDVFTLPCSSDPAGCVPVGTDSHPGTSPWTLHFDTTEHRLSLSLDGGHADTDPGCHGHYGVGNGPGGRRRLLS